MVSRKVIFTKPRIKDIDDSLSYLLFDLQNKQAAINIERKLRTTIEKLRDYPEMYQIVNNDLLSRNDIRKAIVGSYSLYYIYFAEKCEIVLLCFVHNKREIQELSIH